ncbi:response regulator [Fredinandcohnia humi]
MYTVIMVEDQELLRKSLVVVLENMSNIKVIGEAGNGEEAIRLCEAQLPDVILMDIQMPVMNGVEATKVIKKRWPEAKVVILTTFEDINHVKEALNAGAEGYILKAVDPEFLIKGIELVLSGGSLVPQHLAKKIFQLFDVQEEERQLNKLSSNTYKLSEQELKVLKYLSQGLQNKVIAEMMYLSVGTIKNYISTIYSKLEVSNRSEAVLKAMQESILIDK